MGSAIVILSALNVLCLLMHELDACHQEEWKMFGILNKLNEKNRYLVFLYLHIPILLICFLYLYAAISSSNKTLWIAFNMFSIFHLIIHLMAMSWKTNVFKSGHSYLFITGSAAAGLLNMIFLSNF